MRHRQSSRSWWVARTSDHWYCRIDLDEYDVAMRVVRKAVQLDGVLKAASDADERSFLESRKE